MSTVGLNEQQVAAINGLLEQARFHDYDVSGPTVNVRQGGGKVTVTVFDDDGCPRGRYDITAFRDAGPKQIQFTRRERAARWWLFKRGWAGREIGEEER